MANLIVSVTLLLIVLIFTWAVRQDSEDWKVRYNVYFSNGETHKNCEVYHGYGAFIHNCEDGFSLDYATNFRTERVK